MLSILDLISFVGSISLLKTLTSEIDFFMSLIPSSSAISLKDFLNSLEIFLIDLENEPICLNKLGISFGPTTIIIIINTHC